MTVSTTDVRDYLNKLSEDRVKDEVIQSYIDTVTPIVNNTASADVTATDKDNAIKAYAGYMSFNAYCLEYERANGQITPAMTTQLNQLASMADTLMRLAQKGNPVYSCPVSQPTSLEDSITTYPITVGI